MFNFFKKNKESVIVSPQSGTAIPVSDVPDKAFSDRILGDGIAIIPEEDEIVSPADGTVVQVPDTLHAYGIQTENGIDILIHVGINTVELKGEGFKSFVKAGQKVKTGDPIARVDLKLIKEKGYPTHTPVIITNPEDAKEVSFITGKVKAGETVVIRYQK